MKCPYEEMQHTHEKHAGGGDPPGWWAGQCSGVALSSAHIHGAIERDCGGLHLGCWASASVLSLGTLG